jgi:hypothetical protein
MALQTAAIAGQSLRSNQVGTPTDTNATIAEQQRKSVFNAVHADMLEAGQVRSYRVLVKNE